jgi:hypothetical protein
MKCDSLKFSAAISIVAVLSIASYVLLRVLKRVTPLFGVTYLAVSIWESLIWLWQAGRSTGINPTSDALRGVILLIFSISWLVIFSASSQKTDVKAAQPNRWGT